MKKVDRVIALDHLLRRARQPVPLKRIREELECSEKTVRRTINVLRDRMHMPLEYDIKRRGWLCRKDDDNLCELPGLWFSVDELYALMVSYRLLSDLQPGVLDEYIEPIRQRVAALIAKEPIGHPELDRRVRIVQMAARPVNIEHFRKITSALLERKRLRLLYHGRARDQTTERTVSPQRLVYYRANWYLDAWCHNSNGLRTFSLDRLHPVVILDDAAKDISDQRLDGHVASSYGIFAGAPKATAVLRFTPSAARWVADEQWHPQQHGKVLKSGGYELRVPYSDPRELAGDILRYGPEVEVIGPKTLRTHVSNLAKETAAVYSG
ncbi:MAG: Uncharacterized protein FD165_2260 [Gammaproteobacteria bacterium]|nr:MAG: Uncharacterized protein FD165_2260 [Gammaproteobacteria bacterium]TND03218.1 MAG: Uncharacterized protein FD120_1891 [Gammaproteobacteria bacterium]